MILLLQAAQAAAVPARELTPFAWAFMLVSMGSVTAFTIWAFARILRGKAHFDPDGTGPAHSPVPGREDRPGAQDG